MALYKSVIGLEPRRLAHFWSKVTIGPIDQCWPWTASYTPKGYGQFGVVVRGEKLRNYIASRYAYAATYGDPPRDMMVLHSCDNRACCNPAHLRLGTVVDNAIDMKERKRQSRGSARPLSKLTEEQVKELTALWLTGLFTQRSLADMLGVNQSQISRAVHRKRWKHVELVAA